VSAPDGARVLRLITRLNIGGPARQALLLTRELTEFRTTLAAGTPPPEEGELTDPLVTVQRVPFVRPLHPAQDARAARAVRRLLMEARPAILHTHMAKAGSIGRLVARASSTRPRTVHTFHGHVLEGYFGPVVQRTFIEIERRLARSTDVLVAVSDEIRDALLDLGIGRPGQIHVVPLGLELTDFAGTAAPSGRLRTHLGLGPDTPLVGVVGRLVPIKDVHLAIDAVRDLPGTHLAVIGDGELRGELEDRVAAAGLDDRVHFTGWWPDIPGAMSDLDVVLLTSRNEGTPVALIEASAAARPVVATRVGGVPLVVVDGVTGFVVAPASTSGVVEALGALMADADKRARFGQAGRAHVLGRFGHDRLLADVRELYGELLRPRPVATGWKPARRRG
jgi:glycosyltransferase involved in cell wall biosynthesis